MVQRALSQCNKDLMGVDLISYLSRVNIYALFWKLYSSLHENQNSQYAKSHREDKHYHYAKEQCLSNQMYSHH